MVRLTNNIYNSNALFKGSTPNKNVEPQNNNAKASSASPAFGEGPTKKLIKLLFPEVGKKEDELNNNVKQEGKQAVGLIGDILTAHIPGIEQKVPRKVAANPAVVTASENDQNVLVAAVDQKTGEVKTTVVSPEVLKTVAPNAQIKTIAPQNESNANRPLNFIA